ncbi:MAG: amidohydrolase, partial [bacterium]
MLHRFTLLLIILSLSLFAYAQKHEEKVIKSIEAKADAYQKAALNIWQYAEVGYQETQSVAQLQQLLEKEGFSIESGVAGIPTAFMA